MSEASRLLSLSFLGIDYTRLRESPLNEAEIAWVDERLRAVGLR